MKKQTKFTFSWLIDKVLEALMYSIAVSLVIVILVLLSFMLWLLINVSGLGVLSVPLVLFVMVFTISVLIDVVNDWLNI